MTVEHTASTVRLLRDEQDVRNLGYRFADACNRDDGNAFRRLWAENAFWIIDEPMNIRIEGADAIADTRTALRTAWDFFVQMPHAPVISVDGDRATSSWTVSEHAINSTEGSSYFNYARYDDVLARTPQGWRYLKRHYRYYHLDQTPVADNHTHRCRRPSAASGHPSSPTLQGGPAGTWPEPAGPDDARSI